MPDDLKKATVDQKTQFVLSASTDDYMILSLNHDQALYAIREYAKNKKVIPDEAFITKMTMEQLQCEERQIRDMLQKVGNKIPIPTLVRTVNALKSQKELIQNLRRADISNLDVPAQATSDNPLKT